MAIRASRAVAPAPAAGPRRVAVDVFRGLVVAAMVVVNNPGDWAHVYAPLRHAAWHGWTPTDLIFPFFLFVVGVSVPLSAKSLGAWGPILRRAALLVALGLFLAGYPRFDLASWRLPGVLQRIGLCYLLAVLFYRRASAVPVAARRTMVLGAAVAVLTLGYWALLALVPVPGRAAGDLSPDGNLGAWIDRVLMTGHLWRPGWDPEGLLGTLPALATTLLGVITGSRLEVVPAPRAARHLALAGVAGVAIGLAWDRAFPINKSLWTSSYVLFTAGAAALMLALLTWVIDVRGWRGWVAPFVILGRNAITLFVLSGLAVKTLLVVRVAGPEGRPVTLGRAVHDALFRPLFGPEAASLAYALAHLAVLFALLAWMYRRRLFVTL